MLRPSYLGGIAGRGASDVPALRPLHPVLHRWALANRAKTIGATSQSYKTDLVATPRAPRAEMDAHSFSTTDRSSSLRTPTSRPPTEQSHLATVAAPSTVTAPSNSPGKSSLKRSSSSPKELQKSLERPYATIRMLNPAPESRARDYGAPQPRSNPDSNLRTLTATGLQITNQSAHLLPKPQTELPNRSSEPPQIILLPSRPTTQPPTRWRPEPSREPSVRIGMIDIHIEPQPVPIASPRPARRAVVLQASTPLARAPINSFGLRQG
jgi:hypothetical protein